MSPPVRKLVLTTHLVLSIGWIGAVIAYIAVDLAAISSDPPTAQAGWTAMALIGQNVIVPLAVASLVTGLVMALGTPWGLIRHYWVLISLILTVFAVAVLIEHMPGVVATAQQMGGPGPHEAHGSQRGDFLHAGGGLVVLLVVTVLNVFKPRGMTRYGWQRVYAQRGR